MPRFRLEGIRVSNAFLDPARQERAIENALNAAAENIRIDFGVTVQTWKERPRFTIQITQRGERVISTDDLIFKFVSGGTRVRYATMSKDWISKTQPNVIGSGPGRGRKMFVSRAHPRPGIKARNFPHIIVQKWTPRLPAIFARMIRAELTHG